MAFLRVEDERTNKASSYENLLVCREQVDKVLLIESLMSRKANEFSGISQVFQSRVKSR